MRKAFPVCATAELLPGKFRLVTVNNVEVGLFNLGEKYVAYRNLCPHQGAPICQGRVAGTTLPSEPGEYRFGWHGRILHCPWHGWQFDLQSGQALSHRAHLPSIEIAVENGTLVVYL